MSAEVIYNDLLVVGAIAVLMVGVALKVWPLVNRNKSWQASVDLKLNELKNNMEHKFQTVEEKHKAIEEKQQSRDCLLYTSPSPRDRQKSRMPSSA